MLNSSQKPSDSSANSSNIERSRLASVVAEDAPPRRDQDGTAARSSRASRRSTSRRITSRRCSRCSSGSPRAKVRACVSIPPQHGKTETVLHALAWFALATQRVAHHHATYQQDQSDDKELRRARHRTARRRRARSRPAEPPHVAHDARRRVSLHERRRRPATGQGAQVFVVDDPVQGSHRAMSATTRARRTVDVRDGPHARAGGHERGDHPPDGWRTTSSVASPQGAYGDGWEVVNLPMLADDAGEPAPRPYDTATRVLNPRRAMSDGRTFGWTLDGARRHVLALPEADAEALCRGRPRKRVDGALWSWDSIDTGRVRAAPQLARRSSTSTRTRRATGPRRTTTTRGSSFSARATTIAATSSRTAAVT